MSALRDDDRAVRPAEDRPMDRGSGAPPAEGLPERALIREIHRSYCVATWGPMLIAIFNGAVRGERVRPVVEAARRNCRRHPEGGGFTLIVGPHAGLPDADARRLTSDALVELGDHIHSAAVLVDWDGFRAATARSAVSTMFFATGKRLSMKVFKSLPEAARWQSETVRGPAFDGERYQKVVEEVRRQQAEIRGS